MATKKELSNSDLLKAINQGFKAVATKKDLADVLQATNRGFDLMERRFQQVEHRLEIVERGFEKMQQRLDQMDARLEQMVKIIDKWPAPSTVNDLLARVTKIERKLGIKYTV